jgi:Cap4 SAVED domain
MTGAGAFSQFVHGGRLQMQFDGRKIVRAVHRAEVVRASELSTLEAYMADRVPYFYKDPSDIARTFEAGYFLSAVKDVLRKLPTAPSFQQSHFGEILAAVYAEEVLGLGRIYSKLAMLTAENANAFKMDVLFYRPGTDPVEFVFSEVKSSMKTADEGLPAGHDATCFANLFTSFNKYKEGDLEFDLDRIKERLSELPSSDREAIKQSLLPHRRRHVQYAGFCVIDSSTQDEQESALLATRRNAKTFDVELLCVAELPEVVGETYKMLSEVT